MQKYERGNKPKTQFIPLLLDDARILVSSQDYFVVGNTFSKQFGVYHVNENNNYTDKSLIADVAIDDFANGNIAFDYYISGEDTFAMGYAFNAYLSIKNNGKDTLFSFAIYADLEGGFNCLQNFYYKKYSDTLILPGQTMNLPPLRAYQTGIRNNQICFEVMAPNAELEQEVANNKICKTFVINNITENQLAIIAVFPNPASNSVIISTGKAQKATVLNAQGQAVMNFVLKEGNNHMTINHLPTGVYFIQSEGRVFKFIKN